MGLAAWGVALSGLGLRPAAHAQQNASLQVAITRLDDSAFPHVVADVTVADATGWPVANLTASDFTLTEDQRPIAAPSYKVESIADLPLRLVLALDVSIDKSAWIQVQSAITGLAQTVGEADQIALVTFADGAALARDFTNNPAALQQTLSEIKAGGSFTNLNDAVSQAADKITSTTGGRAAIIVIGDSADNANLVPDADMLAKAQKAQTPIFFIGFGAKVNRLEIQSLVSQTGGQAFFLNTANEVATPLRLLWLSLRQGYRLTVQSQIPADKASYPLVMRVANQTQSGEATTRFTATPGKITVTGPGFDTTQPVLGRVFLVASVESPTPIKAVDYLVDKQLMGSIKAFPYSLDLDTSTFVAGSHLLTIRATDASGNSGEFETTFIVSQPPPMTLALSASENALEQGEKMIVTARPDSVAAITQVEFWVDDQPLGKAETAPYALEVQSGLLKVGEHVITARASNTRGEQAEATVALTIKIPFWQVGLRYIGLGMGWLGALVLLVLTAVLPARWARAQTARVHALFNVEITNAGNARSQYELQLASEPPGLLKGEFLRNGAELPTQRHGPMARPASPQPAAKQAKPAQTARPQAKPKSDSRLKEMFGALWSAGVGLLQSLSMLVGGSLGRSLNTATSTARRAEYTVDSASRVKSDFGKVGEAARGPAAEQAKETVDTDPIESASAPAPVEEPVENELRAKAFRGAWARTPEVPPGETITVQARVIPLKSARSQLYTFRISSHAIADERADPQVDRLTASIQGVAWWRQALPILFGLLLLSLTVVSVFFLLSLMR
jgi:VWFA-related protein